LYLAVINQILKDKDAKKVDNFLMKLNADIFFPEDEKKGKRDAVRREMSD